MQPRTHDPEHPTIIPMYTMTTPQAPSGHTTRPRPRAYAIGHKVNPLLNASPFHSCETWLLPNAKTLCMLRNRGDNHGDARSIGQVHTEADQEVPQVESPRSYSGRTSGRSPDIRRHQPEEDQRETEARRLYSGRTSGAPRRAGHPAPARKSGARYPESRRIGHSSPDIRPASPDIRHLAKARTSGPTPGHPAPLPACSASGPRPMYPFVP